MVKKITLNEEDFSDILNGMVDGVITINQHGIVLTFNKRAESIFGYASEEVIGQNVSKLMPEPERSAHDSYLKNHITTGVENIIGIGRDVIALRKNGETFPMRLSVIEYPAKIEGDRWFIGSCRDITLQKQQEEQLRRSIKMEAIGKLTSGIAHDYNNTLGVIMGFTDILARKAKDHPEFQKYIQQIKSATERGSKTTKQLMSITRKRADSAEVTQINDVLLEDKDLLIQAITPQIKLSITTADDLWKVFVDRGCLEDVVLNLIINAMHAMPEGGKLDIATSNTEVSSVDAQVLNIPPGDYARLTVSDTGIGMSEEVVSHIFEPFYSTKGEKGTGLGLSQVFNFVNQAKGTIRVYSEVGIGTRFTIFLPRYLQVDVTNKVKPSESENQSDFTGSESILVVDDDKFILKVTDEILSSHGYSVFCADTTGEALEILNSIPIKLVISDVIMPDIDGFELAHIISSLYPDIRIQLSSGFSNPKGKSVTIKALAETILEKPYTAEQLLKKVRELLDS